MDKLTCSFDGCDRPVRSIRLCSAHYSQRRNGKVMRPLVGTGRRFADVVNTRDEDGNKACRSCNRWLPESSFHVRTSNVDGLTAKCKECLASSNRKARIRVYGITPERYEEILASQGGRCAVCRTAEHGAFGWHIDHDHSCCSTSAGCGNCVRGILCRGCNLALGMVQDDADRLRGLAAYLEMKR